MKKLLVGATVLATLTLAACNHNQAMSTDEYATLVAEAQEKQAKSHELGNVWQQRNMKLPYVDHYLAEAEKARQESIRLAREAVKSANAQIEQSKYAAELRPGWYRD
ncbi:hypothetical protein [Thiomicrospira cyclica]|uniref:Lipoprotein n=1 Tax=Thiomicrospira cyclica (strain DSM 14477 / JCM 11371 / ALM1) TaxID=717773 RepID=F6DBB8_THICA|nr:hypothetical protein [Thiomicrospira cyclica]AEG31226.1 hypothetical protein Thicy_0453 [Thiomicrospira cyclica ALM1]